MIDPAMLSAVIATRNRGDLLLPTIRALDAQTVPIHVLVVDQSDAPDARLEQAASERPWLRVHRDSGRGLSRARNVALEQVGSRWIAYVDDDCRPEPEWAERLAAIVAERTDVASVTGHVEDGGRTSGEHVPVTVSAPEAERTFEGRWTRPWDIGFGAFMAVRGDVARALGGWDERLGAGTRPFPAGEDMDFNYRFLRSGGRALISPALRLVHDQWRTEEQLPGLFEGYMAGWSGFAAKQLRTGDLRGGAWLWALGALDALRMTASAVRRRSPLRARISAAKLRGLAAGTVNGLTRSW